MKRLQGGKTTVAPPSGARFKNGGPSQYWKTGQGEGKANKKKTRNATRGRDVRSKKSTKKKKKKTAEKPQTPLGPRPPKKIQKREMKENVKKLAVPGLGATVEGEKNAVKKGGRECPEGVS